MRTWRIKYTIKGRTLETIYEGRLSQWLDINMDKAIDKIVAVREGNNDTIN